MPSHRALTDWASDSERVFVRARSCVRAFGTVGLRCGDQPAITNSAQCKRGKDLGAFAEFATLALRKPTPDSETLVVLESVFEAI